MAPLTDLQILVTAQEAFTPFEERVLDARERIDMGFRVFDLRMPLQSPRVGKTGSIWADLLLAKLNEGVRIDMTLTDFDPVARPWLHRASWKSASIFAGIREICEHPENLSMRVADHPARIGLAPRLAFWPKVRDELVTTCADLNAMTAHARTEALRCMPGLRALFVEAQGEPLAIRGPALPELMPATHHQKVAVIDDTWLYIGGLDLDPRRYDTPDHTERAAQTWHDLQLLVQEPRLARAARDHLERFRSETEGTGEIVRPPGLLRTLSTRRVNDTVSLSPETQDKGLADRYTALIGQAERFIYLESQFLRDASITDALVTRAGEVPELGLVCLLPAAPLEVAFEGATGLDMRFGEHLQVACLDRLTAAFGPRLFVATPAQPRATGDDSRAAFCGAPIVFVHSKVGIFDDTGGIVSSANLNGRSLRWDTELGLELDDPAQVRQLRDRVMGSWLPEGASPAYWAAEPATVAMWRDLAMRNRDLAPEARAGFLLPYDIEVARAFGRALPGMPPEMV